MPVLTFDRNSWQNLARGVEFIVRQGDDSLVLNSTYDSHPGARHQETDEKDHGEGDTNS